MKFVMYPIFVCFFAGLLFLITAFLWGLWIDGDEGIFFLKCWLTCWLVGVPFVIALEVQQLLDDE